MGMVHHTNILCDLSLDGSLPCWQPTIRGGSDMSEAFFLSSRTLVPSLSISQPMCDLKMMLADRATLPNLPTVEHHRF